MPDGVVSLVTAGSKVQQSDVVDRAAVDVYAGLNVVKDVGVSAAVRPRSTGTTGEATTGGLVATRRLNVHVQRGDSRSSTLTSSSASQTVNPPSLDVTRRVSASGDVPPPTGE